MVHSAKEVDGARIRTKVTIMVFVRPWKFDRIVCMVVISLYVVALGLALVTVTGTLYFFNPLLMIQCRLG